jgi:hypothetical protein
MEIERFKENCDMLIPDHAESVPNLKLWSASDFLLGPAKTYYEIQGVKFSSKIYKLTEYYAYIKNILTNDQNDIDLMKQNIKIFDRQHNNNSIYIINKHNNGGFTKLHGIIFHNPMNQSVPYLKNMNESYVPRIREDFLQRFLYYVSTIFYSFSPLHLYKFVEDAYTWYLNEEDWNEFCIRNEINLTDCGLIRFFITMERNTGSIPDYHYYKLTKK